MERKHSNLNVHDNFARMEEFMKLLFISLGCDKNLVDTEVMLGILSKGGFEFTDDETQADVIVVNTCCFINSCTLYRVRICYCGSAQTGRSLVLLYFVFNYGSNGCE